MKVKTLKKHMKGLISLLLVLSVMASLIVPYNITVFAETAEEIEENAKKICALLYYIDPNKVGSNGNTVVDGNIELVFQNDDTPEEGRESALIKVYKDFGNVDYGSNPPWYADGYRSGGKGSIYKVTIKEKIAPTKMAGWFWYQQKLVEIENIENIDTKNCTTFYLMFNYSYGIRELDLTSWDTSNITNAAGMFSHQGNTASRGLKKLNISNWTLPKCTNISNFLCESQVEELDISSMCPAACNSFQSMLSGNKLLRTVKIGPMCGGTEPYYSNVFNGCENLESVYSEGDPVYGKIDLSAWTATRAPTFSGMFKNCKKIVEIDFGDNFKSRPGTYAHAFNSTFEGCTSLETVKLDCLTGGFRAETPTFKDCVSLTSIDFSDIEVQTTPYPSDISASTNIFEGCDNLREVTFNSKYPTRERAGNSVPSKETWARIKNADGSDFTGKEVLPATQLFLDFQSEYAGTWVAVDKIILDANGGKPSFQSIDGAKGMKVVYQEPVTATRTGYEFDGWWSEKTGGSKLEDGVIAESWNYYAHWKENQYNLVLHGNGGKVPDDFEMEGATVSEDRESITFSNINYTQFVDISSLMFVNEDGSVLASWNIRKNGTSTQYAANDSINKLAIKQGDTAELYAQWHMPSAVITFDSQGGSEVESRNFEIGDRYGVLNTPFKDRDIESPAGYTFVGWFTEPNGNGYQIVNKDDDDLDNSKEQNKVIETRTLYAYWMPNCAVIFDGNGGTIDDEPTMGKVCMYNHVLGKLPTPENDSKTFEGWYTDRESGSLVHSDTVITEPLTTLYARWAYEPKFDTQGGSFTQYSANDYKPQNSAEYMMNTLPAAEKFRCEFLGWYADEDNDGEYEKLLHEHEVVDLSHNNLIKAKWREDNRYTVSLNLDGGSVSGADTVFGFYEGDAISGLPVPVKAGFEFDGWYDGDTKIVEHVTTVNDNMQLTARWIKKDCKVTFDPNGGEMYNPSDSNISVVSGETLPSIPGANKKEDDGTVQYFFGGWFTNPDGTGDKLEPDTVITDNRIYYAKWVDPKNYVYIQDGGATDMTNQLYMYSVTWGNPSDGSVTNDTGDNLSFHPIGSDNISALLRIQFYSYDNNSSTEIKLPPGSVKIKIPKYIFKDRNGNNIGTDNIDVGLPDEPVVDSDRIHFYYNEIEENGEKYYLIINSVEMTGKHDDFEIFYEASPSKIEGGYIDEKGFYRYTGDDTATTDDDKKYYTNDFDVKINVDLDDDSQYTGAKELDYTKSLSLDVHTRVNTTVSKVQTDVSMNWKSQWGSMPADADEYYYVTWNLKSVHSGSTQPFALSWSEDTVRDGAIVVPPHNNPDSFGLRGSSTTEVVTKHRRDTVYKTETGWANAHNEAELEVTWQSGYKQQFRASADAYAYIEDDDEASGTSSFTKRIAGSPEDKDDHYKQGGQEEVLIDKVIPLDYVISYTETKRETAPVWHEHTGTYTTPLRTMTIEDGAPGDLVFSDYSKHPLPHESDWNSSRDIHLSENDYYFDKLVINVSEFDAIKLNEIWSNPFIHENTDDYSDDGILISIRREGDKEIEHLMPITQTSSTTIDLPNDTVWFSVSYSSSFYTTNLQVTPTVCLKPTNHVKSLVQDHIEANKDSIIKNKCRLTFKEGDNEAVVTDTGLEGTSGWSSAYVLNIGESRLFTAKNCAPKNKVIVDNATASESIPVVISGWGYNTNDNEKPIKSASFYDLLPEGYAVDRSTIMVVPRLTNTNTGGVNALNYNNDDVVRLRLPAAYYAVSFSDNWNHCGRALMTVDVNIPDGMIVTGLDVYYMMNTTYANVIANGATPNNIFAYKDTTPGQSVPVERSKTLNEVEAKFKSSLAFADSNQTAYNWAKLDAWAPVNISSGLSSSVKAEGTTISNHQVIGRNTDYSYSISYNSDSTYTGENIVLYDLIERKLGGSNSEWFGEFNSVDVSGIKNVADRSNKFCSPVIYYSTHENITQEQLDVDNSEIWTTTMPPKDQITAVAVDCRKNENGDPFILAQNKGLAFDIKMHSPSDVDNNLTAYNDAYVKGYLTGLSIPIDNITQTRVTVKFPVPQFVKDSFPSTGTIDDPESVVKDSMLEYVLKITNPDEDVAMENVTVEDLMSDKVRINNAIMVQFNDDEPISIEKAAGVNYDVSTVADGTKFSAVIETINQKETVTITIPVTVTGEINDKITNIADIVSVNGVPFDTPVESNPTYHVISDIQVKVLKANSKGIPLSGAELQILDEDKNVITLTNDDDEPITSFLSKNEVVRFNLNPGNYYLRELNAPDNFNKYDGDIAFRIDSEGIIYVDNKPVSHVELNDEPKYKVIFHENNPEISDKNVVFRTYEPNELEDDKSIKHFYDIPKWAGDEYVFAGWYYNSTYTKMDTPDSVSLSPSDFENDKYPQPNPNGGDDPDYHLYAKWIKVGTVSRDTKDTNITEGYRGFGLAGVQIRPKTVKVKDPVTGEYVLAQMFDPNIRERDPANPGFNDDIYNDSAVATPEGLRFITSLSERLLSEINGIEKIANTPDVGKSFGVEYGYAVGTEENIDQFIDHYKVVDRSAYNLQYKGENVNGVNTTAANSGAESDYRYITNIDCTSNEGYGTKNRNPGRVKWDHRNFDDYRLYTLVVTYDTEDSVNKLDDKIDARSYIRYYDANGKLRVFYNTYRQNTYYGGCMCSFNQVGSIAIPSSNPQG